LDRENRKGRVIGKIGENRDSDYLFQKGAFSTPLFLLGRFEN
jgi:hypothetical protein